MTKEQAAARQENEFLKTQELNTFYTAARVGRYINKSFLAGVDFAKSQSRERWISVSDRLPEENRTVWVFADHGDSNQVYCEIWSKEVEKWHNANGISHWSPCDKPSPPESPTEALNDK